MGNQKKCATKHDHNRTDGEERKERKHENIRKLRYKIALERNEEAHGSDKEMKNVEAHGHDEGMKNVEEHIDKRNEEHGGDEEMTNVEQMMGNNDIETMIGE